MRCQVFDCAGTIGFRIYFVSLHGEIAWRPSFRMGLTQSRGAFEMITKIFKKGRMMQLA
jgi:hypothetical protein